MTTNLEPLVSAGLPENTIAAIGTATDMVILVAEDHADSRMMLKTVLEAAGHSVIEAADGREAVDLATTSRPDLILMDVAMPVMDGLVATRILRSRPETSNSRIIALTAHGNDPVWRKAALLSGCDACYAKPLDLGSITKLIEDLAGR